MPDVTTVFLMVAAVILLGFAAGRIFQLTRFPDIPVLLAVGLLLGPLNRVAVSAGSGSTFLVEHLHPDVLRPLAPFVSALALIVILFDSGLKLDFREFGRSLRPAFLHTLPIFLLTVLGITLVARYVFGMDLLVSVVLGVALSNVGQTVSAAIIRDIDLHPEVRSIYFMEMAIYDLVSIPILVSLLAFAEGSASGSSTDLFLKSFAGTLSVSLTLGLVGGVVWIQVLRRLKGQPLSYMLTLAALLALYSANKTLGGSGAVSVLLFGIVIGNRDLIRHTFNQPDMGKPEEERVQEFHDEITFFVRTFFFLFLGITFTASAAGAWPVVSGLPLLAGLSGTAALFLVGVALVFGAIVGSRWVSVRYLSARRAPHRRKLFHVFGRGLGTAVLATLPFISEAYRPGTSYYELFSPWEAVFTNTALLIVLLTVLASSIIVWVHELSGRRGSEDPKQGPETIVEVRGSPRPPRIRAGR